MKKIIDGKRYDTEKAKCVASYENSYGINDFKHYSENLYLTTSGSWFLHGSGGPMTKYSKQAGDATCAGEDIIPMTEKEVIQWMEEHEEYEGLEHYFPDSIIDA